MIYAVSHSQAPCFDQPLDVVFVVDATSSMREELAALPQNLQYISGQLVDADLRTGGLVFRDQTERFIYRDYPLRPAVDSTWHFLTTFKAVGGGDDAEPLNDMLLQAKKFDWRADADKLVIFLSDAPPRNPERTEDVVGKLNETGIRVAVLSPDGANEAALAWQQEVAEGTGGVLLDWEDPYWHEALIRKHCPEIENAVKEMEALSLSIFPNPAREAVTIQSAQGSLGSIRIWDNQGREIFSRNEISETIFSLDIENWTPGVYWVQGEAGQVVKLVVVK